MLWLADKVRASELSVFATTRQYATVRPSYPTVLSPRLKPDGLGLTRCVIDDCGARTRQSNVSA